MNERQLAAFVTTARLGSMSRAAEHLYLSHPALKKQLDRLEAELGCKLLLRTSEGCTLTSAGRELLPEAERLLQSMEGFVRHAQSVETAVVKLCTLPDISVRETDEAVLGFMRANPTVRIVRVACPTTQWLDAVATGAADVCSCFTTEDEKFDYPGLRFTETARGLPVSCFVSASHRLACLSHVAAEDLRGEHLFVGSLLWHYAGWRAYADGRGFDATPLDQAGMRYDLIDLCEQGWVCVHPASFAHALEPLVAVPLDGYAVSSGFAYRDRPSRAVQAFVDYVATVAGTR